MHSARPCGEDGFWTSVLPWVGGRGLPYERACPKTRGRGQGTWHPRGGPRTPFPYRRGSRRTQRPHGVVLPRGAGVGDGMPMAAAGGGGPNGCAACTWRAPRGVGNPHRPGREVAANDTATHSARSPGRTVRHSAPSRSRSVGDPVHPPHAGLECRLPAGPASELLTWSSEAQTSPARLVICGAARCGASSSPGWKRADGKIG